MTRDDELNQGKFRVSENGLEAVPSGGAEKAKSGRGTGDKTKVIILVALVVAGLGVAAFQFLRGGSAKTAEATTAGKKMAAGAVDVDSVLKRLESGAADEKDLAVASVEQLVKEFDERIRERQLPLKSLQSNPFEVLLPEEEKAVAKVDDGAAAREETEKAKAALKAQADAKMAEEARIKKIQDTATKLVLGSVMVGGQRRWASINNRLCGVGDSLDGFRVETIEPNHVVVVCEGERVVLRLPTGSGNNTRGK